LVFNALLICFLLFNGGTARCNYQSVVDTNKMIPPRVGTFDFGLNGSTGGWYSERTKVLHISYLYAVKANYFVLDRLSLGISYIRNANLYSDGHINRYYHNGSSEVNYIILKRSSLLFSITGGYIFGQYRPYKDSTYVRRGLGSMAKSGINLMVRFGKKSRVYYFVGYFVNFNLNTPKSDFLRSFPYYELGIHYVVPSLTKRE
jgi:hypothetical protein